MIIAHNCLISNDGKLVLVDGDFEDATRYEFSHDYKIVFTVCNGCDSILDERDAEDGK